MATATNHETVTKQKKILIVDDHPIIYEGLARLIEEEKDMKVCGYAQDAFEALQAISNLQPDMVIVDISLKSSNGIDLLKSIKSENPRLPTLVQSMHSEGMYAERALRAGAKGYIMKDESPEKLVSAIRQVLNGKLFISEKISAKIMGKLAYGRFDMNRSPIDTLSDRELQVFHMLGEGQATRLIARKLHLSPKTIETYRSHIKEKLGLTNSSELLQSAIQWVANERGTASGGFALQL